MSIARPGVDVPIIGYIDVEEDANNVDWKTGKAVTAQARRELADAGHDLHRLQQQADALPLDVASADALARDAAGPTPEMVISPHPTIKPLVDRCCATSRSTSRRTTRATGPMIPGRRTVVFMDYKGGPACNFCGFRKDCIAWGHERVVVTDMNDIHGKPITFTP